MNPLTAKSISIRLYFIFLRSLLNLAISYIRTVDNEAIKPCSSTWKRSLLPVLLSKIGGSYSNNSLAFSNTILSGVMPPAAVASLGYIERIVSIILTDSYS